ncbi:dienelactone hydrolase [Massariosphaeria phaeospora]|uniref:Dienelactone hydrolase n=1 Tax=Massariosphaeria phaeospora TaxID=100035 RepID=A0A7C8I920_9PLEO|nr:dienelactone hydrolase [Massariosphaeria phaeospora]
MALTFGKLCAIAAFTVGSVAAKSSCVSVRSDGEPAGEFKNVSGIQVYHSYPVASNYTSSSTAILYISDIFGVPLLENKLLADSIASANYPVIMPDLFRGDAVPAEFAEKGLNLTEWLTRHPTSDIDSIIASTLEYMHSELGVERVGAVGYCFGGKYVPRFMAHGKGIDVGFIAHPSRLEVAEIQAIRGPISIAAGELDASFNATARRNAEDILSRKNATYQTSLYSGAPHGFAVRVNASIPREKFAKEASFVQAVTWFDAWLL